MLSRLTPLPQSLSTIHFNTSTAAAAVPVFPKITTTEIDCSYSTEFRFANTLAFQNKQQTRQKRRARHPHFASRLFNQTNERSLRLQPSPRVTKYGSFSLYSRPWRLKTNTRTAQSAILTLARAFLPIQVTQSRRFSILGRYHSTIPKTDSLAIKSLRKALREKLYRQRRIQEGNCDTCCKTNSDCTSQTFQPCRARRAERRRQHTVLTRVEGRR